MSVTGFIKKTALPAALLLGALVSLPASAVTFTKTENLGDLVGSTVTIGNTFSNVVGSFVDTYVFDLSEASQSVGTTVTFSLSLGNSSLALSNMTLTLMDGAMTVLGSDTQAASGNTLYIDTLLGVGTGYSFVVAGDVTGSLGGSYAGLVAAVPVPEAETYAMMLAGLGLVGLMARRRRQAT